MSSFPQHMCMQRFHSVTSYAWSCLWTASPFNAALIINQTKRNCLEQRRTDNSKAYNQPSTHLNSFWDFLHHQGNCTSRQVICRKTVPLLSLYFLNLFQCSRLYSRLARVIEKNTTRWSITKNPPAFCYHLHGYSAKPLLFRKSQGVYLKPSRSCHVPLDSNYFPFSSGFICISMCIVVAAWKTISKRHFELFPRCTKDFDPGPLSVFCWS